MIKKYFYVLFMTSLLLQPCSTQTHPYLDSITSYLDFKQSAFAITAVIVAYLGYTKIIQKLAAQFAYNRKISCNYYIGSGNWQDGGIGVHTNGINAYNCIKSCLKYQPTNFYERFMKYQVLAIAENALIFQSTFGITQNGRSNKLSSFLSQTSKKSEDLSKNLVGNKSGDEFASQTKTYYATDMILVRALRNTNQNKAQITLDLWAQQTVYLEKYVKDAQEVLQLCVPKNN